MKDPYKWRARTRGKDYLGRVHWELVNGRGEVLGWLTPYQYGSGWAPHVSTVPVQVWREALHIHRGNIEPMFRPIVNSKAKGREWILGVLTKYHPELLEEKE